MRPGMKLVREFLQNDALNGVRHFLLLSGGQLEIPEINHKSRTCHVYPPAKNSRRYVNPRIVSSGFKRKFENHR